MSTSFLTFVPNFSSACGITCSVFLRPSLMARNFTVHHRFFAKHVRIYLLQSNDENFPQVKASIQGNFSLKKSQTLEGPTFFERHFFCLLGLHFFLLLRFRSYPTLVLCISASSPRPLVVCSPPPPLLCLQHLLRGISKTLRKLSLMFYRQQFPQRAGFSAASAAAHVSAIIGVFKR